MKRTFYQWLKDLIASFDNFVPLHNKSMGAEQSSTGGKLGDGGGGEGGRNTSRNVGLTSRNSVEEALLESSSSGLHREGASSSGLHREVASSSGLHREGGLSPRQDSVCSDTDLPYVSYTVNKPIGGDSPKKTVSKAKSKFSSPRLSRAQNRLAKSSLNTLVTVNNLKVSNEMKYDEDLIRLQEIPVFLPILQGNLQSSRDGNHEILSRLDPSALNNMLQSYQDHMRTVAARTAAEQGYINKKIREVEAQAVSITNHLQDRQKKYDKHCEKLSVVRDISRSLAKCHMLLNENIDMMDALNSSLPQDLRLEPFVWTTG